MGLMPFITPSPLPAPSVERAWAALVRAQVEGVLAGLLELPDEVRLEPQWAAALERMRGGVLHPAERPRPALLLAGYCLARGSTVVPASLWRFAAGLELLHAALGLHDEVLAPAGMPRERACLAEGLAPGRTGDHLAVVMGDHLFARALESMLESGVPGAAEATEYCLRLQRVTTVGVFRAEQGGGLLEPGGVRRAFRLVRLRAVRGGVASSLVCGAMLAGADDEARLRLARVGCGVGLAAGLRQEWAGLLEAPVSGVPGFAQGRCGFPLVAAWCRARPEARRELEALERIVPESRDAPVLARVRMLVEEAGGFTATGAVITRCTVGALRALTGLPNPQGVRDLLEALIGSLAQQTVTGEAP